jgi:IclR family acetate operon transcriptional repressor
LGCRRAACGAGEDSLWTTTAAIALGGLRVPQPSVAAWSVRDLKENAVHCEWSPNLPNGVSLHGTLCLEMVKFAQFARPRSQWMRNVLNALRVLEEVATRQPVGVGELARVLDIPKSSVQRALQTLNTAGWIRPARGEVTRWVVTTKALDVGRHASGDLGLRDAAVPIMEDLRRRTDETIHLTVPEGDRVVLIERLETSKPLRISIALGHALPLHASANGKAVLASGPLEAIARLLAEGLPRYTDTTITEPDRLLADLDKVRTRGYATNHGEWRTDVGSVAAAIMGDAGEPVASLSVNLPRTRLTDESQALYGNAVSEAARSISARLGRLPGPVPQASA